MKKLLVVLIIIGLGLAGGTYWFVHKSKSNGEEGYTFAQAEFGPISDTVNATGQIQLVDFAVVFSPIPGQVEKVLADFGEHVDAGDELLKLDSFMAESKLKQAEADLEYARAAKDAAQAGWEKYQDMEEAGASFNPKDQIRAKHDLDAAKAKVKAAKGKKEEAEYGLKFTTIRAPMAGTIVYRRLLLGPGQLVGPPSASASVEAGRDLPTGLLFVITRDLKNLQVHAQIGESDIGRVKIGMNAVFTVYAYSDRNIQFKGKVGRKATMPTPVPSNAQAAVFYDTVIDVENQQDEQTKEWMLRPGMTAAVDIIRRSHKNVWKVPTAALNLLIDESSQTEEARKKLQDWRARPDADDWKPLWIMKERKPWPVFVRIGGKNDVGETRAITDGNSYEVLDWDPELRPDSLSAENAPRFIISVPTKRAGFLDQPSKALSR